MDVSKNRGILPPKWMVKIMENPIKMDDLGVPLFLETPMSESGQLTNRHGTSLIFPCKSHFPSQLC